MATKKVTPKNPEKEAAKQAGGKTATRKTASSSHKFRKTSSVRSGH